MTRKNLQQGSMAGRVCPGRLGHRPCQREASQPSRSDKRTAYADSSVLSRISVGLSPIQAFWIARTMLAVVIDRLRTSGVRTVFLWVLDGNLAAAHLYKNMGFISTDYRQPLPAHPAGNEERMRLDLG
jgi:hypothetical protein